MGNSNSVKKHFETSHKTGVCQLINFNLTEFPEDIQTLKSVLRTLNLSQNRVSTIPDFVSSLSMLKSLNLDSNRIERIPESIGQLKKLETLSVSMNLISVIPSSVANLRALRKLVLSHNRIAVFPADSVYSLKNLDALDLSNNRLTNVPDGIDELQVIELNLNENQISVLSADVTRCPRLKVLRLEENCLDKGMITPHILKESRIAVLALEGNLFPIKDFPHFDGYEQYQERFTATKKKMG